MTPDHVNILGIWYSTSDDKDVLSRIDESVRTKTKLTIIQPHFYHAVLGWSDPNIFDLYQKYDIALPDGYGMYLAGKFLYQKGESVQANF